MKFSISLNELQKALAKTFPAIPSKTTLYVLEHLHFSAEGNKLQIISTDQDITILTTAEINGESDGKVLVPAKRFFDIVKALGSVGTIDFESDENNFEIHLRTSNGKYSIKGLDPDEYLTLPELFESKRPEIDLTQNDGTIDNSLPTAFFAKDHLIRLCEKTTFAVSMDDFRPAMTGVLFQFRENYVNSVSTDSFRLVKAVIRTEKVSFPQDFDVILPLKTVDYLKKVDSDSIMSVIETNNKISHVRFDIGNTIFVSRVINEKFPPYENVLPKNNSLIAKLDMTELANSLKRVSLFSSNSTKQVKLLIENNNIVIFGKDEEKGNHGDENISCEYNDTPIEISFNSKFLEDAINNIKPDDTQNNLVNLAFSENTRPVVITPVNEKDDLFMLVMPVRV